jgi:hypothetical protein
MSHVNKILIIHLAGGLRGGKTHLSSLLPSCLQISRFQTRGCLLHHLLLLLVSLVLKFYYTGPPIDICRIRGRSPWFQEAMIRKYGREQHHQVAKFLNWAYAVSKAMLSVFHQTKLFSSRHKQRWVSLTYT